MKARWIEFFIVTGVYLFFLIMGLHDIEDQHTQIGMQLHLLTAYTLISFYLLYIYPSFFSLQKMYRWMIWVVLIFFAQALTHYVIFEWYRFPTHQAIPPFALSGMVILCLLIYTALKATVSYLYSNATFDPKSLTIKVLKELLIALALGLAVLVPTFQVNPYIAALTGWSIPFCYILFATHQYYLLPYLVANGSPKTIRIVLSILTNLVCITLFSSLMEMTVKLSDQAFASFNGFSLFFCMLLGLLITPIIYLFFYNQQKQQHQIVGLEKQLGKTSADLKLLQSQINPHFLFNIMNTLYSIALIENAENTASGIQKLSEMMRFMLHENQQDSILLAREIDYILEYIDIQKLRIADLPSIDIKVEMPDEINRELYIAPMLLIPFIENAFKHGISLNKPSWIRIRIQLDQHKLKLSVYNSVHTTQDADPEKNKSGIGLQNVLNRLLLMYPDRHDVHFEETNAEYFIFLTINLKQTD